MTDGSDGERPPPGAPLPPVAPLPDPPYATADLTGTAAPAAGTDADPPGITDGDEPLLPTAYDGDVLRDAIGAKPKRRRAETPVPVDDDDPDGGDDLVDPAERKRRRRTIVVSALSLIVGLGIAALVFLGRANSARYALTCESDRVVVAQGRSFPPWGTHELTDPAWKAVRIPAEAECHPRETEDEAELASWYARLLEDQASGLLQAREVTKVDDAETDLKQALLVIRLLASDDDRKNQRKDIERMLGDVAYWRASAKLRGAVDALGDAAKQFDAAAVQRPRYVDDSAAWAAHVRKLADDLRAGPAGVTPTAFPPLPAPAPEHLPAPVGVALPVEPDHGSDATPAAAPVDAGLPTGGVLL